MGKLILIEGTDCSGKETQSKMVIERLESENYKCKYMSFPQYDTPTGQIIGGAYLGKEHIGPCIFPEGAANVPPKVASLYYAADRLYNSGKIKEYLEGYDIVFLDRYIFSNMAHQGGKILDKDERVKMYKWLHELEFELLELPKPEQVIFLHMPYDVACILKAGRSEKPDGHESDEEHLKNAERAYLELANMYEFDTVECSIDGEVRTREEINEEVYKLIKRKF